jgi:transposase
VSTAPPARATCSACGTTVEGDPPLTWSTSTGPRGRTVVCDRCTRDNVRSIEAKLEQEWW